MFNFWMAKILLDLWQTPSGRVAAVIWFSIMLLISGGLYLFVHWK